MTSNPDRTIYVLEYFIDGKWQPIADQHFLTYDDAQDELFRLIDESHDDDPDISISTYRYSAAHSRGDIL